MPSLNPRSISEQILEDSISKIKIFIPDEIQSIEEMEQSLGNLLSEVSLPFDQSAFLNLFQADKLKKAKKFAKGFPGIVLTAAIGKLLDKSYDPVNNFYSINPRPLFEQHIGPVLRDKYKAPMGKSDPLNVAKNAKVIDKEWARGRRPEYAANTAVQLIAWINSASPHEIKNLVDILVWFYLSLAKIYSRKMPVIEAGVSLTEIYFLLKNLIDKAPAGGSTSQAVIGTLLQVQHFIFNSSRSLDGIGDSVNATNTTTGKAGDFSEMFDQHLRIYEVTTKKVNIQRINESADSVKSFLLNLDSQPESLEVTFLCCLEDLSLGNNYIVAQKLPKYQHDGISYSFIELEDWMFFMLERIGAYGRSLTLEHIQKYVESPSTDLKVKSIWENPATYQF